MQKNKLIRRYNGDDKYSLGRLISLLPSNDQSHSEHLNNMQRETLPGQNIICLSRHLNNGGILLYYYMLIVRPHISSDLSIVQRKYRNVLDTIQYIRNMLVYISIILFIQGGFVICQISAGFVLQLQTYYIILADI